MPKTSSGSPHFPEVPTAIPSSSREVIDKALELLQARKDAWVSVGVADRIAVLDEIKRNMLAVAGRWIGASLQAKGLAPQSYGEGEEWIVLSVVFRGLRLLRHSLMEIKERGRPRIPGGITVRQDAQAVARVFPRSIADRLLFRGITGEIWMEPGVAPSEIVDRQADIYRDKDHKGRVCLVLAAGNLAVLPVMDFLHKMFVEDQVVVLKTNPVNAYLGPLIEQGFRALIERGFLRVVYGGADEGSYLTNHSAVDEIHLTGSDKTFDAIVFGPGQEGVRRKADRRPILTKHFTAELGNVTPAIIVPGSWGDHDIRHQALKLCSWLEMNAGFNCLTPRVIVQHKGWPGRSRLVEAITEVLSSMKTRKAYYPGAQERHNAFVAAHPEALQCGSADGDHLPWTLIANVDPGNTDDICFTSEAFCSVFGETALEASSTAEFLDRAVEFANETLWGTLTATIIVHPESLKDPDVATAVDRAVAELRYGSVCVNLRGEYAYLLMVTPWGAFPGHEIFDVQSGIGCVNNLLMCDKPQKAVIRGPFKMTPDPFMITFNRLHEFGRKMAYFEASPSLSRLLGLTWTAIRS